MQSKLFGFLCSGLVSVSLFAEDCGGVEPGRKEALPAEHFKDATDPYLEGYIQALVDAHYYEFKVLVSVKDHKVHLSNLPKNELLANSIIAFVKDLPGVHSVEVVDHLTSEEEAARTKYVEQPRVNGIWFPQSTVLFQPLVADPRQVNYSVNLRFDDRVIGGLVAAVSLGDDFPFFRWRDIFRWHGDMQIGIEAGIWAVFTYSGVPENKNSETCALVNTDYYVGIPLTYAVNKWSFRLRLYHISSHLGDEFMCNNTEWVSQRRNPSFETVDFFLSYQFSSALRVYFGQGIIVHSDNSFPMKTFYEEGGFEVRLFGKKFVYHRLYGTPFFAADFQSWQVRNWSIDQSYKLGYELSKLQGIGRKMRLYGDYHQGFSYEGQFFKRRTNYYEIGFSWGF
jgi:hypothetical protein